MLGAPTICNWYVFVVVWPVPSATCTGKEVVPVAVGVPPRTPPGLRVSPAGKLEGPEGRDQVYEPEPPLPVKVNEYGRDTSPCGSGEVEAIDRPL